MAMAHIFRLGIRMQSLKLKTPGSRDGDGIFSSSGNPERKNNEDMFSLEYWVGCNSHRKEVPIGSHRIVCLPEKQVGTYYPTIYMDPIGYNYLLELQCVCVCVLSNAQEVLNSPLLLPEKSKTCKDMAAKEDFYFECL